MRSDASNVLLATNYCDQYPIEVSPQYFRSCKWGNHY